MYRKIKVKEQTYEYVIGKSHTKIKGIGIFLNADFGEMRTIVECCDCCGEPLSQLYSTHVDKQHITVTPAHIAKKILGVVGTADDTFAALKK